MKLYAFSTGQLNVRPNLFGPNGDKKNRYKVPVQSFLIMHPKGNVLVDTGIDPNINRCPEQYWGKLARVFEPVIRPEELIINQLKKVGVSGEEIDYVIMTHLHMDHAGALRFFPYANIIVNEKEIKLACKAGAENEGYFRRDWDYPLVYEMIRGRKDLFDDGRILIEPAPGHTDGMQIVVVQLKDQKVVLASDSAATMATITKGFVPQNISNKEDYIKSVERLSELHDSGALVICGHDDEQWKTIKKAPEFYGEE